MIRKRPWKRLNSVGVRIDMSFTKNFFHKPSGPFLLRTDASGIFLARRREAIGNRGRFTGGERPEGETTFRAVDDVLENRPQIGEGTYGKHGKEEVSNAGDMWVVSDNSNASRNILSNANRFCGNLTITAAITTAALDRKAQRNQLRLRKDFTGKLNVENFSFFSGGKKSSRRENQSFNPR